MKVKEQLYKQCAEFITNRLITIKSAIQDVQQALESETKSTAGDKHETGRAMLQLEREKAGQQLAELQKQNEILQRIDVTTCHQKIALGSVIYTTDKNYFIAISSGALVIDNHTFYAVSASTPIAKLLLTKMEGDVVKFRGNQFTITSIE